MKYSLLPIAAFVLFISHSCKNRSDSTASQKSYFDVSGMDTSVKPGDNFYEYVNGTWLKNSKIPDDQSAWGSFYTLYEENLGKLKGILEEAAKSNAEKGSLEQKVGDYYASGMDTLTIEKLGAEPLRPALREIDAVKDHKSLMQLIAKFASQGEDYLIGYWVGADDKNSAMNILTMYQSGLSLPEKDYYTRTDSATQASRVAFKNHITQLFVLCGEEKTNAEKNAEVILALETEMAKSHRSPVELRNPRLNYNKMAMADFQKRSPNISWNDLFASIGIKTDSLNVGQPGYYESLSKLLVSQPLSAWKTKLKYDYISTNAGLLSKAFSDANFEFDRVFSGQKKDSQRWKKMVGRVDRGLGDLLGQLYVKKYFNDTAKKRMDELVNNLQKAFSVRIEKLDWMSSETKTKAQAKLNSFMKKIGYPDKWKNFDDVNIDKTTFFANALSVRAHHQKEKLAKINQPVDRTEWGMSPPTVNAYYNPSNNEIVFPAGILQFPFFDANADDAINYGAIGMVIGHEMTHGFDDQGSQYDDKGNLVNWWTSEDGEKFKGKTTGLVDLYSSYTILDNLHVKGDLTLGENIADVGGLAIAYDAFKMTQQGQDTTKIDGFSPDQRFFLGYAQVWRMKSRDESLRSRITTDPHSPEIYRVNGPASNFDPFYAAFNVKEGDKMYIAPEKRAKIW